MNTPLLLGLAKTLFNARIRILGQRPLPSWGDTPAKLKAASDKVDKCAKALVDSCKATKASFKAFIGKKDAAKRKVHQATVTAMSHQMIALVEQLLPLADASEQSFLGSIKKSLKDPGQGDGSLPPIPPSFGPLPPLGPLPSVPPIGPSIPRVERDFGDYVELVTQLEQLRARAVGNIGH